ncbi:MAG: SOS response-associated peptidase [Rubrivivax sp.]|nr:SOS response-associated peptidase [Rubrivivax sp.]MDH5338939.1 SOS response-associated peptidase [Rubrivivax sp.]
MCNLYHMAPRDHVERYFRAQLPAYAEAAVGPFGTGLFLRPHAGGLHGVLGQWGMIQPRARARRPDSRAILTNNARAETVDQRPTYRTAWAAGQRCLVPAAWYQEPNWETGRNVWWRLARADGAPWAIAGLWSEWADPASGEIVPSYTMLTVNCDGHALLGRLHRPDPKLPADAQDKRSLVPLAPSQWAAWLHGTEADARALLAPPPADWFDPADALRTDALLAAGRGPTI